jgi:Glycine cleavage H-protein
MFPGVDGFAWDAGHIIFLGAFFAVLLVLAAALLWAALRSYRDESTGRVEKIRWHADFAELSPAGRRCRHELTGEIESRQCPNEFDCRVCRQHPQFVAEHGSPQPSHSALGIGGLRLPLDRLYHRGHAWAKLERDGTYTIGPDELAQAVVGRADVIELPARGSRVFANGTGWIVRKGADTLRVLSPIDGEVLETNGTCGEWRMRVKPPQGAKTTHLLAGSEAVAWFRREFERLQGALGDPAVGVVLADGGLLVDDLEAAYPKVDWDAVRGGVFLEP